MTEFEIISAPEDYNHPVSQSDDPRFEIGNLVRHVAGDIGIIESVSDFYINRASKKIYRRNYEIELRYPRGGYIRAFGYELTLLDVELHRLAQAYQERIDELERLHSEERFRLLQKFVDDVKKYDQWKVNNAPTT